MTPEHTRSMLRGPGDRVTGQIQKQISEELVRLHKQYLGVGPSEARTYIGDDLVVCVLRGGFTRVEETLRASGRGHSVVEQRAHWQESMSDRFTDVVENATGRAVQSFMSGNHQEADMTCEVFILAPAS